MAEDGVKIPVEVDTKPAEKELKAFEKTAKDSGKSISESVGGGAAAGINGFVKGLAGLAAGYLSVKAVTAGLKEVVGQAMESDRVTRQFTGALASIGVTSESATKRFTDYASSLQKAVGVSDDLILRGGTLLASIGKLSGEGLERATKASLNLSAALGMDQEQAFMLVAKAADGNTAALARYGIRVDESIPKSERFAAVLRQMESRFKGASEAAGLTFEGALNRTNVAFGEILENIGKAITGSPVLIKLINEMGDWFFSLGDRVAKALTPETINNFILSLAKGAQALIQYVLPPFELFFNIVKAGFDAMAYAVIKIGGLFSNDLKNAGDAASAAMNESFNNIFAFDTTAASQQLVDNLVTTLESAKEPAKTAARGLASGINTEIQQGAQATIITIQQIWEQFKSTASNMKVTAIDIAKTVKTSLGNGFSNAFSAMGQALVKGEDAFAAFGKAILGMFGDIALQLSAFYLALGIGNLFINPAAAAGQLAAGAALGIIGGILKALSGGVGGAGAAPAGASGGGGGAGSVGLTESAATTPEDLQELQKPATNISVNVQGNILDRRQTGLELAEVIRESFDVQGTTIQTATI